MSQPSSPHSESIASNSSFPSVSVSSSFFFSSAAHSPHTQSSESGNASEAANQGLIIPSLTLPEALHRPTPWGKTLGDLRILILDLEEESQSTSISISISPHAETNTSTLIKALLRENEDVVQVDDGWEWDEVGHVPVRVLHASTDWIEHSDPHGLEKYDPARNVQILDVGKNDVEDIKRIVLEPFHELAGVLPSASSSTGSSSIGLLANLISAPTTPLYTALLLLAPSSSQVQTSQNPKYTRVVETLGTLVPIIPVLVPSTSSALHASQFQYKFTVNPTYSPSYHHHRHPDHPLASTHPHYPMAELTSGSVSTSALHSQSETNLKLKPMTLPILRNTLFRPSQSDPASSSASHSVNPNPNHAGSHNITSGIGITTLRSETAELFLRWWRVEGIVKGIVQVGTPARSRPKLEHNRHGKESTITVTTTTTRIGSGSRSGSGFSSRSQFGDDDKYQNVVPEGDPSTFGRGSWLSFKARWEEEWEKKWEHMEGDLSRDVAVRLREVREMTRETERKDEEKEESQENEQEEEELLQDEPESISVPQDQHQHQSESESEQAVEAEVGSSVDEEQQIAENEEDKDKNGDENEDTNHPNDNMDEGVIFQLDLSPHSSSLPQSLTVHSSHAHTVIQDQDPDELERSPSEHDNSQATSPSLTNSYSSLSSFEVRYHHAPSLTLGLGSGPGSKRPLKDDEDEADVEEGGHAESRLSKTLTTKDYHSYSLDSSPNLPPPPPSTSNTSPQPASSSSSGPGSSSESASTSDEVPIPGPSSVSEQVETADVAISPGPKTPRAPGFSQDRMARRESTGTAIGVRMNLGTGTIRRLRTTASARSRSGSRSTSPSQSPSRRSGSGTRISASGTVGRTFVKPKNKVRPKVRQSSTAAMLDGSMVGKGKGKERAEQDERLPSADDTRARARPTDSEIGEIDLGPGLGFDPLHLPSLLVFSLSLLRPLRDRVRELIGVSNDVDASMGATASSGVTATEGSVASVASTVINNDANADDADTSLPPDTATVTATESVTIGSSVTSDGRGRNRGLGIFVVSLSLGVGVGLGYVIGRTMNRVVVVGVE
ncbi:hypothetical protein VKT23_007653 [Stygiomarasmius scandens]|uniref:Uncharacterized protein n=1 Tax=Marasmiellus scandens TaxID=2682957 RepID=A0ABR1JNP5_9AGAR